MMGRVVPAPKPDGSEVTEMTKTNSVNELLARMGGKVLVIDPVTDTDETARSIEVRPFAAQMAHNAEPLSGGSALMVASETITDPELIRALYDHPTAEAYGDGSYTVEAEASSAPRYHRLIPEPLRKFDGRGVPIGGHKGLVYVDDAAREGYQLCLDEQAGEIRIGDLISVGSRLISAEATDPRPGFLLEGKKVIPGRWERVRQIGEPFPMQQESGHYDDAKALAMDGFIATSRRRVMVRRIYFEVAA
jgi:hypothetical protein